MMTNFARTSRSLFFAAAISCVNVCSWSNRNKYFTAKFSKSLEMLPIFLFCRASNLNAALKTAAVTLFSISQSPYAVNNGCTVCLVFSNLNHLPFRSPDRLIFTKWIAFSSCFISSANSVFHESISENVGWVGQFRCISTSQLGPTSGPFAIPAR